MGDQAFECARCENYVSLDELCKYTITRQINHILCRDCLHELRRSLCANIIKRAYDIVACKPANKSCEFCDWVVAVRALDARKMHTYYWCPEGASHGLGITRHYAIQLVTFKYEAGCLRVNVCNRCVLGFLKTIKRNIRRNVYESCLRTQFHLHALVLDEIIDVLHNDLLKLVGLYDETPSEHQ